MENKVILEVVHEGTMDTYIEIGKKSYCEHYLHLWEQNDPSPYIISSFAKEVVQKELKSPNIVNFLVKTRDTPMGIVKLVLDKGLDELPAKDSLLAQKIYLLKAFSGMGIGKQVLLLIEDYAKKRSKKVVWLDTMKKGKPLQFYLKHGFKIKKESELQLPGAIQSERPMWILTKQL